MNNIKTMCCFISREKHKEREREITHQRAEIVQTFQITVVQSLIAGSSARVEKIDVGLWNY